MAHATTQDSAAKWLQAMQSATAQSNYEAGINAYQGNPMQAAADADQKYLAAIQDAVQSGRRRAALLAVPAGVWKANAIGKGKQRLSSGAAAALPKVQAHFAKWTPIYQQVSQQVRAMPKNTIDDGLNRVRAVIVAFKQAAGKPVS